MAGSYCLASFSQRPIYAGYESLFARTCTNTARLDPRPRWLRMLHWWGHSYWRFDDQLPSNSISLKNISRTLNGCYCLGFSRFWSEKWTPTSSHSFQKSTMNTHDTWNLWKLFRAFSGLNGWGHGTIVLGTATARRGRHVPFHVFALASYQVVNPEIQYFKEGNLMNDVDLERYLIWHVLSKFSLLGLLYLLDDNFSFKSFWWRFFRYHRSGLSWWRSLVCGSSWEVMCKPESPEENKYD